MNKEEFERKKQQLWVYLRHDYRCAVCGNRINPEEAAEYIPIPKPLDIDRLLKIELIHPCCRAARTEWEEELLAA